MAIVDRPRRVLLSAVRPCADVDDILIEQVALFHQTDRKVNSSGTAETVEIAVKNTDESYKII